MTSDEDEARVLPLFDRLKSKTPDGVKDPDSQQGRRAWRSLLSGSVLLFLGILGAIVVLFLILGLVLVFFSELSDSVP